MVAVPIFYFCDVDYLFSNDVKYLFRELGLDDQILQYFKSHIEWLEAGDPRLSTVVAKLQKKGNPKDFDKIISNLSNNRVFVLRKGAPETHYKNSLGQREGWEDIKSEDDLLDSEYLKELITQILS